MASRITDLPELTSGSLSGEDYLLVVDKSIPEAKKTSLSDLFIFGGITTGWTSASSMTYLGGSSVTIPSGGSNIYSVGDKIRFQNNSSGSYLYFYVTEVSDTILTLAGDSVPNAVLTDRYYSKVQTPLGFPNGFHFVPSWKTSSDPQPSLVNGSSYGYFSINGRTVTCSMQITYGSSTTGGTNYFYFGLPTLSTPISGSANTMWRGNLVLFDSGTNWRIGTCYYGATVGTNLYLVGAVDSASDLVTKTNPFTFTTNDIITLEITYVI